MKMYFLYFVDACVSTCSTFVALSVALSLPLAALHTCHQSPILIPYLYLVSTSPRYVFYQSIKRLNQQEQKIVDGRDVEA